MSENHLKKTPEKPNEKTADFGGISWYYAKYPASQEPRGLEGRFDIPRLTEFVSGFSGEIDQETGEIISTSPEYDARIVRLERFALQSAARRLLPKSRTAKCLRFVRRDSHQKNRSVEVYRSIEHRTGHYGGLQTCGSVWSCPVCAAKVSERRRAKLLSIMDAHKAAGGECLLLTLTFPHDLRDDLPAMLKSQAKAYDSIIRNRPGRAIWADMELTGTVKALEVTHGENGWHPHFHVLLFCASVLDRDKFRARIYIEWSKACVKAGLDAPSYEHGCRLDGGEHASAYVTKGLWGLDYEMTKGHIKKATKGRSPFDLLRSYLYDDDKQAGALFVEYAAAFKGKRQLQYSNGLKNLYEVDDSTDEELAAVQDDTAELLGLIEFDEWRLILRFDLRGDVLELARYGWEPIQRLIESLRAVAPAPGRRNRRPGAGATVDTVSDYTTNR